MDSPCDLLVIGGGINGAGIARDAAGRGLSVLLCEQGDPAGATSSASSKLIHGGLRYLEHHDFRLVRESLREREILLRIAPHLMRPARFVLPHTPHLRPAWMIRLGLTLYDWLGGSRSLPASASVDLTQAPWDAWLKAEYRKGFIYSDVQTDDARLVVLTLRDAVEHGATVLDRSRVIAAHREASLWRITVLDVPSGEQREYRARVLVNAAGPWVAALREQVQQSPHGGEKYGIRLIKGSHIVVPRLMPDEHAFTLQQPDGRVVFLLPFEQDYTLIGTTEIEHADPDTPPAITTAEIDYLCTAASQTLRIPVATSRIVWSFAGLRALFDDGQDNPGKITRDYHLQLDGARGEAPLLSVFGGKLTTYRALAETVMGKLAPWFPALGPHWTATTPLPGGDRPYAEVVAELRATHPNLPAGALAQLARRHGSRALNLLAAMDDTHDLGCNFGGGLYQLEVEHFIRHEWAREADDILWRRSKAGLHMTPAERMAFADWLAANHPGAS